CSASGRAATARGEPRRTITGATSRGQSHVAAAQVRNRIEQATSLTGSLQSYMLDAGGAGITSGQFTRNASRWPGPGGVLAAAWAEDVHAAARRRYERRTHRDARRAEPKRASKPLLSAGDTRLGLPA